MGKSTLLKTICGFLTPDTGKILFKDSEITSIKPYKALKLGLAYIPQQQSIFPKMTVEENLRLGAWTLKKDGGHIKEKMVDNYRRFPPLKTRKREKAGNLSGGEQRMVELSRALMSEPHVLLVDEPTAGLAPKIAQDMYKRLVELKEEGLTILLVDQNIRQAIEISDYVYALELGKNKIDGPREKFDDLKEVIRSWL